MVDYSFYETVYLGTLIPQKAFPGLAARAEAVLAGIKRSCLVLNAGGEEEKLAVCAMAEVLSRQERAQGMQSASVGGVSVRYADEAAQRKALYRAAGIYLDIYRGVG